MSRLFVERDQEVNIKEIEKGVKNRQWLETEIDWVFVGKYVWKLDDTGKT